MYLNQLQDAITKDTLVSLDIILTVLSSWHLHRYSDRLYKDIQQLRKLVRTKLGEYDERL